jgi:chorismate dehydratase
VWGLTHGPQQDTFDLEFAVPAECADRLADSRADIGLVPAVELPRLGLQAVRDGDSAVGIACHGPVRSILLVSKVPTSEIRTLATDSNSRTTVMLARILLAEKWGIQARFHSMAADLATMLGAADAALLIGDAALRVDPSVAASFEVTDLGATWVEWTGLPMVFAVWGAREGFARPEFAATFAASYRYGREHIDEIVAAEAPARRFSPALVRDYLERNITFELGPRDFAGLDQFLKFAAEIRASQHRRVIPV